MLRGSLWLYQTAARRRPISRMQSVMIMPNPRKSGRDRTPGRGLRLTGGTICGIRTGRAGPVEHIGVAFSRAFWRIGKCRYPLYVHPMLARDLFDIRATVCVRRVKQNRWGVAPITAQSQHSGIWLACVRVWRALGGGVRWGALGCGVIGCGVRWGVPIKTVGVWRALGCGAAAQSPAQ